MFISTGLIGCPLVNNNTINWLWNLTANYFAKCFQCTYCINHHLLVAHKWKFHIYKKDQHTVTPNKGIVKSQDGHQCVAHICILIVYISAGQLLMNKPSLVALHPNL